MKLTLKDGTVFEGSVTEYVELLFELNQLAEEEALIKAIEDEADEVITFEGAQYRKVDREAREGDVVVFTDGISPRNFITNGKPYKAVDDDGIIRFKDNDGDYMLVYKNDSRNRTRETVDVYAPVAPVEVTL